MLVAIEEVAILRYFATREPKYSSYAGGGFGVGGANWPEQSVVIGRDAFPFRVNLLKPFSRVRQ